MKLLVYEWSSFMNPNLYMALQERKIPFTIARTPYNARKQEEKEKLMEAMEDYFRQDSYDAVFSINFMDCISEVCHKKGIPYIAWCYDSPSMGGKVATHYYDTNYIFLFDSYEMERHQKMGKPHLYHLDLAVNTKFLRRKPIPPMEKLRYTSDVSLVGQLYTSELEDVRACLSDYLKAFVDSLVDVQLQLYNVNLIRPLINQQVVEMLRSPKLEEKITPFADSLGLFGQGLCTSSVIMLLLKSVTNKERNQLLEEMAKYWNTKLFSGDRPQAGSNIKFCGKVDYYREMPNVFQYSKINLNITLRSIESGIPLRCLDIMGCRSFLLTNYQKDLFNELEEGKDMVVYESIPDAIEKANFYLTHEKERMKICQNGYKKVKDCFNYPRRLSQIFQIVGLD